MPRRQDGEERPGRHPADSLRSSAKPAQKELAIFDCSNTFLLSPSLPAVLGGRPVTLGGGFQNSCHSREGGNPENPKLGSIFVIASLAQQGVAISGSRLPRSVRSLVMTIFSRVMKVVQSTQVPF